MRVTRLAGAALLSATQQGLYTGAGAAVAGATVTTARCALGGMSTDIAHDRFVQICCSLR